MDGEEQPEAFEKKNSNSTWWKVCSRKTKKIKNYRKNIAKIYAKSLNGRKKWKERKCEKTVTANHWKNECNQKTKTINFVGL